MRSAKTIRTIGTQGAELATLIKGTKVNLILCGNSWCRVTCQGRTGYVAQVYLRR
ncbi:SH3 domain-containing protein [Deinococcus kurensis]|uniref:SH3 domain-containing protein n=1 Tax=Deinococcus kurensis TaxID=2662757 RepID=UPI001391D8CE|nr:SH3 domain-containing protein [Deinococcus kurensis]